MICVEVKQFGVTTVVLLLKYIIKDCVSPLDVVILMNVLTVGQLTCVHNITLKVKIYYKQFDI